MTVALNATHRLCPNRLLKLDDARIKAHFIRTIDTHDHRPINDSLVRLHHEREDPNVRDKEALEKFFFGHFGDFSRSKKSGCIRMDYTLTQRFLETSHEGLHWPDYSDSDLGLSKKEAKKEKGILAEFATNYLLKSLWHTYVHNKIQGITHANFLEFEGGARDDSDFEADNLATLFLIHSYGLPVTTEGLKDSGTRRKIIYLLRRNRCNRVFFLRARTLGGEAGSAHPYAEPDEREWVYRRTLSTYLSGWMAVHGFAVTSIGVFLAQRTEKDGGLPDARVVVELNRVRIASDIPAVLEDGTPRRRHFHEIAMRVSRDYVNNLADSPTLRSYACDSLAAFFERAGISCPELENRSKTFAERPREFVRALSKTLVVD